MEKTSPVNILKPIALGIVGAIVGLIVGAFIGGNWATQFELSGMRGYEATGLLGLALGGVLGMLGGAFAR